MAASVYNFPIEQGSSFKLSLTYKDKDGVVVDITGWCARLFCTANDGTTYTFTTENIDPSLYSFEVDGPNGRITLLLPASVTNNFSFNTAKYDLELRSDDDLYTGGGKQTTRILYGTINIVKRFSKSTTLLSCSP